ncbi:TIM barrel protein [Haloferula rosea]|uniref:TIM barrel protein n=1 Tax=Haloferula rosea TaxID=490093 RepID=A0A934RBJ9_9BACT|nr:TIM barrel protein [Haloferula rosea]MBK1828037.1 TIM barrel protein [Haloferula rosea]
MQERRDFIKQVVAAGALAGTARGAEAERSLSSDWPIVFFEKPVQALSYDEIGERLAGMGAQGIEATIRKNGHIKPEQAAKEVPGMLKSLAKSGLKTVIAATDITEAGPRTSEFLKVLRDQGITSYRMGHYRYDNKSRPTEQVAAFRDRLRKLADLNESLGVHGLYQIHSGAVFVGALVWDIVGMLEGIDPDALGLAYDLRHTKNDTGSAWKQAAAVAKPHIRSLYVKDARWEGKRSDKRINVPLDTGFVTREVFDHTSRGLKPMPLSLHMEWGNHQIYPADSAAEAWAMIGQDMKVLRAWRDGLKG